MKSHSLIGGRVFLLLCICLNIYVPVKSQWFQEFPDNFKFHPLWAGDTLDFKYQGNTGISLDADPVSGDRKLIRWNPAQLGIWELALDLEFNPSSSNYFYFFPFLSVPDSLNWSGYGIFLGRDQDGITMERYDQGKSRLIISGGEGLMDSSKPSIHLKVEHLEHGKWEVYLKGQDENWQQLLAFADTNYLNLHYSAFGCHFTSSRSDKFHIRFISFSGTEMLNQMEPQLAEYKWTGPKKLLLYFSEAVVVPQEAIYWDGEALAPWRITPLNSRSWLLDLSGMETDEAGSLIFSSLCDLYENCCNWCRIENIKVPEINLPPVKLSEFLANPDEDGPFIHAEYIELLNIGDSTLTLIDWKIADSKDTAGLPEVKIDPGAFVILCHPKDTAFISNAPERVAVEHFPSLNNDGDQISVLDRYNQPVDKVEYLGDWLDDEGRSLEKTNFETDCNWRSFWKAGMTPYGGSPGTQNTTLEEAGFNQPTLSMIDIVKDKMVLGFDQEPVEFIEMKISGVDFDSWVSMDGKTFVHDYPGDSTLQIDHILATSCFGDTLRINDTLYQDPGIPIPDQLKISEVLFNPMTLGFDFVEVHNCSEKILDLSGLLIEEGDIDIMEKVDEIVLPGEKIEMAPDTYLAITEDKSLTKLHYNPDSEARIMEIKGLPNFPDDTFTICLRAVNGVMLDTISLGKNMHSRWIRDFNGVSLERIRSFGLWEDEWVSASAATNYATPGYENSCVFFNEYKEEVVVVTPGVISPNGDGMDDFAKINLQKQGFSGLMEAEIRDVYGTLIKTLSLREFIHNEMNWLWDGSDDLGRAVQPGTYFVEVFLSDPQGRKEIFTAEIAVSKNMN